MRHAHSTKARRTAALLVVVATLSALAACADEVPPADASVGEHAGEEEGAGAHDAVHLDADALAMADIALGTADTVASGTLHATGAITYDPSRISHVGPRTEGRIQRLGAELGDRVRAGQVLAVLESPDVGTTRADLHEAQAVLEIARENHERERHLEAQGISSRREVLDAEAELRRAEAALMRAQERLSALGAADGSGAEFAVTAPFDGIVVEKDATPGEMVGSSDHPFAVADLRRLWIELDIYERDLERVAVGQPVTVRTTAYPDRAFDARIVYLGDILDLERRTVRARVEVANPAGALKPGMFATAAISVGDGAAVVVVPREAVQLVEGRQVVWVPGDEAGAFTARPVTVGEALDGDRIEILSGLQPGERLVTSGAFTLKAELSKSEFGGHEH